MDKIGNLFNFDTNNHMSMQESPQEMLMMFLFKVRMTWPKKNVH